MDVTPQDKDMMVRTIIGEAGDQPADGQAAVAHVILNRARTGQYGGNTPTDVVLAPHQFEPWQTRSSQLLGIKPDSPLYKKTAALVDDVTSGARPDPTNGATHFLAPAVMKARGAPNPSWAQGPGQQIGGHVFYGGQPTTPDYLENWGSASAPATASPATSAPAASSVPDYLEHWDAPVVAPAQAAPAAVTSVAPTQAPAAPGQMPTLPQAVIDLMAQHQGPGFSDTAARYGLGTIQGIGQVGNTLAQGIGYTGAQGANVLQRLGVISPQSAQNVQDWRAGINQRVDQQNADFNAASKDSTAANLGVLTGNIVGTGPFIEAGGALLPNAIRTGMAMRAAPVGASLAARALIGSGNLARAAVTGGTVGAATNALTSSASNEPIADQVTQGGIIGGALGPAGHLVSSAGSKVLGPVIDQATASLAQTARNYGINVGPGQISTNPMTRFADSVLRRFPFTGYGAQTAQQQTALERAIANEMGQTADHVSPAVVLQAKQDAYKTYDAMASKIGPARLDTQFVDDLQNVRDSAHFNLEPNLAARIDGHLNNIASKVDQSTGTIPLENYQSLTRKNGPLDLAINSRDSKISQSAQGIKDALENLVLRNNPALKAAKDEADYKYFVAKSVEPMVNESPTGGISSAKLLKSVDYSNTPVGDLGRVARRFMTEPNSSGTGERTWIMQNLVPGAVGLAGVGGAYYSDPDSWQRNALIGLGTLGVTRGASAALRSNALARMMINRGMQQGVLSVANQFTQSLLPRAGALAVRGAPQPNALTQ